jgi:K(+)-stimulated pyrophosphate-energized sodium pump
MADISRAIQLGAATFLQREFKVMGLAALPFAALLAVVLNPYAAGAFVVSVLFSAAACYIGISIAARANSRVAYAAHDGPAKALNLAFTGGSVMGMAVVSLSALGISSTYLLASALPSAPEAPAVLTGYSIGASFAAIFVRVGGGIFTKAADMGADLVGKVEVGIPEDDPRNAAVIADQVGDNVGDVAGMGSDLNQSYTDAVISSLVISAIAPATGAAYGVRGIAFPLLLAASSVVTSAVAIAVARAICARAALRAELLLRIAVWSAACFSLLGAFLLSWLYLGDLRPSLAAASGLVVGVLIGLNTEYYTYRGPLRSIIRASEAGSATNIISGLAVGLESSVLSLVLLGLGLVAAHHFAGLYGIAISGVGMLSIVGINVSLDAYGSIADNAGGIAQMSGQPARIRRITDHLDAVGNTTAAIGKAFASSATAAAAISLLAAYSEAVGIGRLDMREPQVMAGLLVGAALPALFAAMVIRSVDRTAQLIVLEVRRQFQEIRGILEGTTLPDYAACVDIATQGALGRLIVPCGLAAVVPLVALFTMGPQALAGLLTGCIVCGIMLAVFMSNAGGAWDNAKKRIEAGEMGGMGSSAHQASVIGDTVGDPLKDAAGPTLNILIQLAASVSLAFAPLFLRVLGR